MYSTVLPIALVPDKTKPPFLSRGGTFEHIEIGIRSTQHNNSFTVMTFKKDLKSPDPKIKYYDITSIRRLINISDQNYTNLALYLQQNPQIKTEMYTWSVDQAYQFKTHVSVDSNRLPKTRSLNRMKGEILKSELMAQSDKYEWKEEDYDGVSYYILELPSFIYSKPYRLYMKKYTGSEQLNSSFTPMLMESDDTIQNQLAYLQALPLTDMYVKSTMKLEQFYEEFTRLFNEFNIKTVVPVNIDMLISQNYYNSSGIGGTYGGNKSWANWCTILTPDDNAVISGNYNQHLTGQAKMSEHQLANNSKRDGAQPGEAFRVDMSKGIEGTKLAKTLDTIYDMISVSLNNPVTTDTLITLDQAVVKYMICHSSCDCHDNSSGGWRKNR
ncbi:hypothetical protein C3I27_04375 [Campylobacter jejuni]|uniref:Uncharacterized protein n=1 Tax=Campylobacter jejuni TaxID=197 RepID=A0A431E9J4_CAMJU|nr:hypothetical protein [Campylobacter jejuni]RTI48665.1 hypothetical protein C3I27_04375 [Campylobacter jejuni]RTJ77998.1 hypothetical protein C3H57_09715 [Campylobacter jejuni]HEG8098418.1 hypothetical protein [Campylobacter jejuni]HEG8133563.1 hypothetical protein [Campylobacter jejuni]